VKRKGHVARIRNATARRALLEAKRVPWPHLARAAEEYTEWHVFTLWARAIVDAADAIPANVRTEIGSRAPGIYNSLDPKVKSAINGGDRPGILVWEDFTCWAEMNVFLSAKRQGWLDAVRYFSAMSLRAMQAWSHWERIDAMWRRSPPRQFPTLQEWDRDVKSVTRLSTTDSKAQRALDVVHSLAESNWHKLLAGFSRLNAFSQWMELMLGAQGPGADLVSRELLNIYPGVRLAGGEMTPKEAVHSLESWVLSNEINDVRSSDVRAALRFHLRYHPENTAIRRYAQFCRRTWAEGIPKHPPTFDEWKEAADSYSEPR
jgi:hypothetical protein